MFRVEPFINSKKQEHVSQLGYVGILINFCLAFLGMMLRFLSQQHLGVHWGAQELAQPAPQGCAKGGAGLQHCCEQDGAQAWGQGAGHCCCV